MSTSAYITYQDGKTVYAGEKVNFGGDGRLSRAEQEAKLMGQILDQMPDYDDPYLGNPTLRRPDLYPTLNTFNSAYLLTNPGLKVNTTPLRYPWDRESLYGVSDNSNHRTIYELSLNGGTSTIRTEKSTRSMRRSALELITGSRHFTDYSLTKRPDGHGYELAVTTYSTSRRHGNNDVITRRYILTNGLRIRTNDGRFRPLNQISDPDLNAFHGIAQVMGTYLYGKIHDKAK